ncbi:MAG: penicillin-binding protein 2 [Oligoflexales bacterium]
MYVKQDHVLIENRFLWASITLVVILSTLLVRLWYVQIFKGEYYQEISERNRVRRIEIPVPRGVIYDRYGEVILGNRPYFDLTLIPQYAQDRQATFQLLSRLLHEPIRKFEKRYRMAKGGPKFLPITLKRNLSQHQVSTIESNKLFLPGIEVKVAPRRDYKVNMPVHLLGFLGEIDKDSLKDLNEKHEDNPYLPGDLIGKQGIERQWEEHLRGQRGYRLIQVDAYGRQTSSVDGKKWDFPVVPAVPGSDLELTIDAQLQNAAQQAFNGKFGAVIVLNPQTGEILAEVSEPSFDPSMMEDLTSEEWEALINHPFNPFLDKTTGGEFAPGSIYKAVIAMAALEEKMVSPGRTVYCPGHYFLGNSREPIYCHDRQGHGFVDLKKALMKSCDVFFYQMGIDLGAKTIAKYASAFGLGEKLGVKLNTERPGLVPTPAWKQLVKRFPWTAGDTVNIAIGQGDNLMTPMQMVSLYAAIANGGTLWRPYLVRRVTNHVGEVITKEVPQEIKKVDIVSQGTFRLLRSILQEVVMNEDGTGHKANVEGVTVAGKTGSVQVVSLKKNRNRDDVSSRWKEHAIFAAFSPVENAEIAVVVVSENDTVGGGGKSAAPVAQKIIESYWKLKEQRKKTIALRKEDGKKDTQQ